MHKLCEYIDEELMELERKVGKGQKLNASDLQQVLEVIDDLMTALAVLNPKLYESVMRKL